MHVVMRDPPPEMLEERRRLGHDLLDEVWDGVLHMVPQPGTTHQSFARERGVEQRAELVVEVLSKNDMSRDKLPFYAACEVNEVWLVDPKSREHEIYVLRGTQYFAATPDRDGVTHAPLLGLDFQTIEGHRLRITSATGTAEI